MTLFGNLFAHDKKAAVPTGALSSSMVSAGAPSGASAFPQAATIQHFQLPGYGQELPPVSDRVLAENGQGQLPPVGGTSTSVADLPTPPPSIKQRKGAFDADHRAQTLLAMSAGFFGSQNFGEGLGRAAQAIYAGNADALDRGKPTLGGPDNAFEVYTDERTGQHTLVPIQAVQEYVRQKGQDAAAARNNKPVPLTQSLDALGRLATVAGQGKTPAEQQALWTQGLANLDALHVDTSAFPQEYSPAYAKYGATVAQQQSADDKGRSLQETKDYHRVQAGLKAQGLAQGAGRLGEIVRHDRATEGQRDRAFQYANPPIVTTRAERDRLAPGTPYIDPTGQRRTKH